MKKDYGIFQVALKVLLHKGDKILFLRDSDIDRHWDWPGGRIDNVEYRKPLEKIIAREIREELGPKIKYVLGNACFPLRRWTLWHGKKTPIFCLFYEAQWVSGTIHLSSEHCAHAWIDAREFRSLKRVDFKHEEEYPALKKYFVASGNKKISGARKGTRRRSDGD